MAYAIKPPLYAFDQNQTHDLLWADIPAPIANDLEETFANRFLCKDGTVWISLIDRYAPLPNAPWANRWAQIAYEFLKQISKLLAIYNGEISGYAYGLSPYAEQTFDLSATIPIRFSFTLAPRSEVWMTWLERAHEVFGGYLHPSYQQPCAVYVRRAMLFKSGDRPTQFSFDSRNWLINSVVFSNEAIVSDISQSEPIDLFLYRNFEATIDWIFEQLAFPTPVYLESWDVSIEAEVRNAPWQIEREALISQTYSDPVCSNPTYQPLPDWWHFAALVVANNNPWGEVEELSDLGKEIWLFYDEDFQVLNFRIWYREEGDPFDQSLFLPTSVPLGTQIGAFQSVNLGYALFTQWLGLPSPASTFYQFNLDPEFPPSPITSVTSAIAFANQSHPDIKRTTIIQYPSGQEKIAIFTPLAAYVPYLNPDVRLFRSTQGAIFVKTLICEIEVDWVDSGVQGYPNAIGQKRILLQSSKGRTTQNLDLGGNELNWSGIGLFIESNITTEWAIPLNQINASNGEIIFAPSSPDRSFRWEEEVWDVTYPSLRVSREIWEDPIPSAAIADPELIKETIDNLLENDLDPDLEELIMADSIRVKEIHAALDAHKFSVNPANTDESRFANLGYYIERVARVLGISVNPDGSIRSIRQVKRLEDGEDIPAGWSIAQWGRNQGGNTDGQEGGDPSWDKDGMAYQVIGNTFLKNPFTGQVNKIDAGGHILVENWAQYFEMLKDDLDKCLGLQEGAANVLPDPDNPSNAIEYEGIGTLVAEVAYMLSEYGKQLNALRVMSMGNQAMLQELIAALGVPVTIKELRATIGDGEGKIPYPAPEINAPTHFDQTAWVLSQLGQIYASTLYPRADLIQRAVEGALEEQ